MNTQVNSVIAGVFLTFFVAETAVFAVHNFILYFFLASFCVSLYARVTSLNLHDDEQVAKFRNIMYPVALIVYSFAIAYHNYNIYLQEELGEVTDVFHLSDAFERAKMNALSRVMHGFMGYYTLLICLTIYF